ncbi:hypothetical protein AMTRI_Chr03g142070 [Amborella trichopoda]
MKIVTWNIRGLGQQSKKNVVKDLSLKHSPTPLALIKTKQPEPTLQLIRQIWGKKPTQWVALPANGASGGIWVIWNPSEHTLISSHLGNYSMTILLSSIPDGLTHPRSDTWSDLDHVAALPHPSRCLGGDFNVTRWSYERNSSTSISQDMRNFADFITSNELIDIPLQGSRFTWSNHSPNPSLSKLNRFPFFTNWEESFSGSLALVLPKPTSDHCPILLDTNVVHRGPTPFKFELAWLEEASFLTLIPTWWASFSPQVRGRVGYSLQSKIQLLKASLNTWSKALPGNYSQTKSLLLDTIQRLDHLEESKALTPWNLTSEPKPNLTTCPPSRKKRSTGSKDQE